MSKRIKIIDLLNKIANREEVPENIKYHNRNLKETDIMLCCKENIIDKLDCESIYLNDEVEIIEEQEEIDIQSLDEMPLILHINEDENIKKALNDIIENQNELVQAVKQLDKNIKEKQ